MPCVQTGLERLINDPSPWVGKQRLGLLSNPASVDRRFRHARLLIERRFPGQLKALYAPQHGFFAEKQDNMVESGDMLDPLLKLPVYSLYGQTRIPTAEMFDPIDMLIVDLQDVGTRVYTYIYTISYCLETVKQAAKKILILDRPNPIGGRQLEGNVVAADCTSFVGRYPIPMRHGLTIGELSNLINDHFRINCDLQVLSMHHWNRSMYFKDTGLPWVAPSPNLPTPDSAVVYPGQVLWEGTNVSEGRGTTQPFEIFGAPFFDTEKILSSFGNEKIAGAVLRPTVFEPTSNKWQGIRCNGFQIHVTRPYEFNPYATGLNLLQAVIFHHKNQFQWKLPPYEYEFTRLPIDLIIGDQSIRPALENFDPIDKIAAAWQPALDEFEKISRSYHLYE
jgi:uncharacterized protein YbbC (DUF1343 family)